jgi:cytochrome subunit of sulfide dehydrogenase
MIPQLSLCLLVLCASVPALAQAESTDRIRLLAANCANCHGTDGVSQGGTPALSGLARAYIIEQMQDFKTGKRAATVMHQLARGYTDVEIEALAVHFSQQKR